MPSKARKHGSISATSGLGEKMESSKQLRELWLSAGSRLMSSPALVSSTETLNNRLSSPLRPRRKSTKSSPNFGKLAADVFLDVTLPGIRRPIGAEHPVIKTMNEIVGVFRNLGYSVEEGPEIETDYYNFEALNFPPNHPARDTQDTLFIAGQGSKPLRDRLLLRTHTSPVQIHTMQKMKPPVRVVCPGKVHRNDAADATHSPNLPSSRRSGRRYQHHLLRSEGHAGSRNESALRIKREDAFLSVVFPFHRAQRRCPDQLHFLRRQRSPRRRTLPQLQSQRMD